MNIRKDSTVWRARSERVTERMIEQQRHDHQEPDGMRRKWAEYSRVDGRSSRKYSSKEEPQAERDLTRHSAP